MTVRARRPLPMRPHPLEYRWTRFFLLRLLGLLYLMGFWILVRQGVPLLGHDDALPGMVGVESELNILYGPPKAIDVRLKLQAGLIQSGARAMARFSEFGENSEERWVALVTRVEALERKLEGK